MNAQQFVDLFRQAWQVRVEGPDDVQLATSAYLTEMGVTLSFHYQPDLILLYSCFSRLKFKCGYKIVCNEWELGADFTFHLMGKNKTVRPAEICYSQLDNRYFLQ